MAHGPTTLAEMLRVASGAGMIGVLRHHKVPGRDSLAESAPPMALVPFGEAFSRQWPTDAHFVCYLLSPMDEEDAAAFCRCNKTGPLLHELRTAGYDLLLHYAALDWDTGRKPHHVPWTPGHWQRFQGLVAEAEAKSPIVRTLISTAAISYASAKGFRWVWRLDPPVPVDQGEVKVQGMIDAFRGAGLLVDELADWTRLFRLPRVKRDV